MHDFPAHRHRPWLPSGKIGGHPCNAWKRHHQQQLYYGKEHGAQGSHFLLRGDGDNTAEFLYYDALAVFIADMELDLSTRTTMR